MTEQELARRAAMLLYNEITELVQGFNMRAAMPEIHPETKEVLEASAQVLEPLRQELLKQSTN